MKHRKITVVRATRVSMEALASTVQGRFSASAQAAFKELIARYSKSKSNSRLRCLLKILENLNGECHTR